MTDVRVQELHWQEQPLGEIAFPREVLKLNAGFGSGLTAVPGGGGALVWAIGDRGPNLKCADARERYGWDPGSQRSREKGSKLMPRPDLGPTLALLEIRDDAVEVKTVIRVRDRSGRPVPGLPVPESGHAQCEPALDLDGAEIPPDAAGMDTEGLALLRDGSFWVGEEYGPSLVRISADGEVVLRIVPEGVTLPGAQYDVQARLPAIAARRHLNRGFEAVAVSPSERHLFVAFQSPLAHPDEEAHEKARHVRIWRLDPSGDLRAQYLYPLDDPSTFLRDNREGKVERSDIKVCELLALGDHELLALERASHTTKIYRFQLDEALATPNEHVRLETRPTIEEMSRAGDALPAVRKQLLFSSDDCPQMIADIEGMALVGEDALLLVSDNDFGVEAKRTAFYRLTFAEKLASA